MPNPSLAVVLLLALVAAQAVPAQPTRRSTLGVHALVSQGSEEERIASFGQLRWYGDLVRTGFRWRWIQPTRTSWFWANTDSLVKLAGCRHASQGANCRKTRVLAVVNEFPAWALSDPSLIDPVSGPTPALLALWEKFLIATVDRYKNDVSLWEIWNEPNMSGFWAPTWRTQALADMVKIAHRVIKQRQPNARVILPAMYNEMDGARGAIAMWKELKALGVENSFDEVGFHPYEASGEQLLDLYGKIQLIWGSKPICVTEYGWASDRPNLHPQESDVLARLVWYAIGREWTAGTATRKIWIANGSGTENREYPVLNGTLKQQLAAYGLGATVEMVSGQTLLQRLRNRPPGSARGYVAINFLASFPAEVNELEMFQELDELVRDGGIVVSNGLRPFLNRRSSMPDQPFVNRYGLNYDNPMRYFSDFTKYRKLTLKNTALPEIAGQPPLAQRFPPWVFSKVYLKKLHSWAPSNLTYLPLLALHNSEGAGEYIGDAAAYLDVSGTGGGFLAIAPEPFYRPALWPDYEAFHHDHGSHLIKTFLTHLAWNGTDFVIYSLRDDSAQEPLGLLDLKLAAKPPAAAASLLYRLFRGSAAGPSFVLIDNGFFVGPPCVRTVGMELSPACIRNGGFVEFIGADQNRYVATWGQDAYDYFAYNAAAAGQIYDPSTYMNLSRQQIRDELDRKVPVIFSEVIFWKRIGGANP